MILINLRFSLRMIDVTSVFVPRKRYGYSFGARWNDHLLFFNIFEIININRPRKKGLLSSLILIQMYMS